MLTGAAHAHTVHKQRVELVKLTLDLQPKYRASIKLLWSETKFCCV